MSHNALSFFIRMFKRLWHWKFSQNIMKSAITWPVLVTHFCTQKSQFFLIGCNELPHGLIIPSLDNLWPAWMVINSMYPQRCSSPAVKQVDEWQRWRWMIILSLHTSKEVCVCVFVKERDTQSQCVCVWYTVCLPRYCSTFWQAVTTLESSLLRVINSTAPSVPPTRCFLREFFNFTT